MRRLVEIIAFVAVVFGSWIAFRPSPAAAEVDAKTILDEVDDLYRSKSSYLKMTMKVKTEHWERTLEIESWTKGKDRTLARILAPKKEKGMATLRVGDKLWNYLPKVKRVIKVPSSMMGSGWMGSHFTNDDIVKESRMADDYTFAVTFEGKRRGKKVIEITCTPRSGAAVVWGKIVVEVTAAKHVPRRMLYYDEDKKLARTMTFSSVKEIQGRWVPMKARILPEDKKGEYTEVRYEDLRFGVEVSDRKFSLRALER